MTTIGVSGIGVRGFMRDGVWGEKSPAEVSEAKQAVAPSYEALEARVKAVQNAFAAVLQQLEGDAEAVKVLQRARLLVISSLLQPAAAAQTGEGLSADTLAQLCQALRQADWQQQRVFLLAIWPPIEAGLLAGQPVLDRLISDLNRFSRQAVAPVDASPQPPSSCLLNRLAPAWWQGLSHQPEYVAEPKSRALLRRLALKSLRWQHWDQIPAPMVYQLETLFPAWQRLWLPPVANDFDQADEISPDAEPDAALPWQAGDWFDLQDETGAERLKLAAVIRQSGEWIFINRRGAKRWVLTEDALRILFFLGLMQPHQQVSFGRMEALLSELRQD